MFDELQVSCQRKADGGFLPAVKQIGNVATLPGIVKYSIGLIWTIRLPLSLQEELEYYASN